MVTIRSHAVRVAVLLFCVPWFIAAEANQSPWERLDPVRRTQVLMALLGLLLLGFLMIVLVLVGARQVRRLARQRPTSRRHRPRNGSDRPALEATDDGTASEDPTP
jgi:hypothetical protein